MKKAHKTHRLTALPKETVKASMAAFGPDYEPRAARVMYSLRHCATLANDSIANWLKEYHLTARTMNVLMTLYAGNNGHGMPIGEIGPYIHTAGARLTATLDGLEELGLIVRRLNDNDRRSTLVVLTPKGRKVVSKAFPLLNRQSEAAFEALSHAERETLATLLSRLSEGFLNVP
jgi:DNA-binding MarR family transcriptional regulator